MDLESLNGCDLIYDAWRYRYLVETKPWGDHVGAAFKQGGKALIDAAIDAEIRRLLIRVDSEHLLKHKAEKLRNLPHAD